jgi:hypothetical protein
MEREVKWKYGKGKMENGKEKLPPRLSERSEETQFLRRLKCNGKDETRFHRTMTGSILHRNFLCFMALKPWQIINSIGNTKFLIKIGKSGAKQYICTLKLKKITVEILQLCKTKVLLRYSLYY